jgi:hypothetical protein
MCRKVLFQARRHLFHICLHILVRRRNYGGNTLSRDWLVVREIVPPYRRAGSQVTQLRVKFIVRDLTS